MDRRENRITVNEIADEISARHPELSNAAVHSIISDFITALKDNILQGKKVLIWNFGLFHTVSQRARKAHDISTGDIVIREPREYPKFEFSKKFIRRLKK